MIVAFTSLHPVGATFIDWSWHWLKGNESFWSAKHGWIPLIDNPLKKSNAHGHKKNHPCDFESWWQFIDIARDQVRNTKLDITFYPYEHRFVELSQYVDNLNLLAKQDVAVVAIKKTMLSPYMSVRAGKDDDYDLKEFLLTNGDVDPAWPIKRLREIASIRLLPQTKGWLKKMDRAFGYLDDSILILRDDEIIDNILLVMEKIFSHHNLKMVSSRLKHWKTVANVWHDKINQDHEFYRRLPAICDSILMGSPLELDDLPLGFIHQSAIMAHLMMDHGARLILPDDDFPTNTADLHRYLKKP